MLEKQLAESNHYYQKVTFSQALGMITRYMTNPPLRKDYMDLHAQMLRNAVHREQKAVKYVKTMISQFLDEGLYQVEGFDRMEAVREIYQDMYGLGVIEPLVDDPEVQEVSVNGFDNIWYEKNGRKYRAAGLKFADNNKLCQVIDRCLPTKEVNRMITFAQANFDDSRIYVGVPPVARVPYLNYRKFSVFRATEENYLASGTFTEEALAVLKLFVRYRANITIIGHQNTGKTTLLSFLTDYLPDTFRIGVLENDDFETAIEMRRPQGNVFSLRSDRKLGVSELDIFKHALRFSADVLIIPEARGAEVEEVLKAQRRGNSGSITTLHSISPRNMVDDMVIMISESGKQIQFNMVKMMVAKALDIVITMHQFPDGKRKIIGISEVDYNDLQEDTAVNDLFCWENDRLTRTTNKLLPDLAYRLKFNGAEDGELKKWGLIS